MLDATLVPRGAHCEPMIGLSAFGGEMVADNFARLAIVGLGLILGLLCLKITVQAWRHGEHERSFGAASYAFVVAAPGVNSLLHFGQPITWAYVVIYGIGLLFGAAALYFRVTVAPPWSQRGKGDQS